MFVVRRPWNYSLNFTAVIFQINRCEENNVLGCVQDETDGKICHLHFISLKRVMTNSVTVTSC